MKAFIKPRKGVRCCYPGTARPLEAEGRLFAKLEGAHLTYWRRRERDGDVTIEEPAPPAEARPRT